MTIVLKEINYKYKKKELFFVKFLFKLKKYSRTMKTENHIRFKDEAYFS